MCEPKERLPSYPAVHSVALFHSFAMVVAEEEKNGASGEMAMNPKCSAGPDHRTIEESLNSEIDIPIPASLVIYL